MNNLSQAFFLAGQMMELGVLEQFDSRDFAIARHLSETMTLLVGKEDADKIVEFMVQMYFPGQYPRKKTHRPEEGTVIEINDVMASNIQWLISMHSYPVMNSHYSAKCANGVASALVYEYGDKAHAIAFWLYSNHKPNQSLHRMIVDAVQHRMNIKRMYIPQYIVRRVAGGQS